MQKVLLILLLVLFSHSVSGQVFSDSTSNFYVGLSIGQVQHNISNELGTYGRSHILPRIYGEFGYAIKDNRSAKGFLIPSLGISYQQLSLHPLSKGDDVYNDKLNLVYLHLNLLVHIGAEKFMVSLGPSLGLPLQSTFEAYSKTSDGSFRWVPINDQVKNRHPGLGFKIGTKIKIDALQFGLSYSIATKEYSSSRTNNPYQVNNIELHTLELILYIPLKL
jgi:hypothetical protein